MIRKTVIFSYLTVNLLQSSHQYSSHNNQTMKPIFLIAFVAFASLSVIEASVLHNSNAAACRPGEKWEVSCNHCECDNDGNAMCTGKICPEDKECTPGDVWQGANPCETCWCSPDYEIRCTWLPCTNA